MTHWDATSRRLIDFCGRTRYEALAPQVVHETKRRIVDTVASALGAWDESVSVMARNVAGRYRSDLTARIWGSELVSTPEMAAFANGVMTRALDVSDTYLGKSRGHPSDMTAGLVALAECARASGADFIAATVLAYDLYCSFCQVADINALGWDQPAYTVIGCAAGAARLLKLDGDGTGHAIALALTPNMAFAQARRGHLASWKGCAGANATRNAVFAALLAQEGFTGPAEIFDGSGGLFDALGRFDWSLPSSPMIVATHTKSLPVCYHGQAAVLAALELRDRVPLAAIEDIHVEGYGTAVFMMGGDPARWAPATRETADHSLPYCVAVALLDGAVTRASFDDARLRDPAIAALMKKVRVTEDATLSAQYPDGAPGRVTIRLTDGRRQVAEIRYPRGHEKSPMSDADLEAKFHALAEGRFDAARRTRILDALWTLEQQDDMGKVVGLLTR